ncbi:MAG: asparagine synthase [Sphingomonadaceae bacterium]|nr:asparagine synthase [Sphingomonadaceae bacterium]
MRSPTSLKVVRDKLTYLNFEKLDRIDAACRQTSGAEGDILEFGVALGGSGILMAKYALPPKRFFGFDVFGQIPPPTSDKDDEKSRLRYDIIQSGKSKGIRGEEYYGYRDDLLTQVSNSFAQYGVPVDGQHVILCQGIFEDTLPGTDIQKVSLAHIDCDWYDPVALCLSFCADRLSPGGMIIIDDYHDYGGCRTAVDEFLAQRPEFALEDGRNPFLVKVPSK